jgi:hypothetical protein
MMPMDAAISHLPPLRWLLTFSITGLVTLSPPYYAIHAAITLLLRWFTIRRLASHTQLNIAPFSVIDEPPLSAADYCFSLRYNFSLFFRLQPLGILLPPPGYAIGYCLLLKPAL